MKREIRRSDPCQEPICPAKAVRYVGQRKQRDGLSRKKDDNTHI